MDKKRQSIADYFLKFERSRSALISVKSGSFTFYNEFTSYGVDTKITKASRYAIACAIMPEGFVFNEIQHFISGGNRIYRKRKKRSDGDKQITLIISKPPLLS